ncbi:hypothetical protein glysoja_004109 [Glycine soja]|nr:hypothetical protein glysoja_004109 [Glycine soja]
MPVSSKIDFCEFCKLWAGQDGDMYKNLEEEEDNGEESVVFVDAEAELEEKEKGKVESRVPLPWELLEPVLRILGHCLLGQNKRDVELFEAASEACRCLFARSMHDVNAKAILPIRSLLRLSKTLVQNNNELDPTELPFTDVISL